MSTACVTDVVRGASVRDRRAGSLLDEWPPKCLAVHEIAGQTMQNPILERRRKHPCGDFLRLQKNVSYLNFIF